MRILPFLAVLTTCSVAPSLAFAGQLTPDEADALRAEIQTLLEEFNAGNADAFVEQTYAPLQRLFGGTEAFRKITQGTLDQLRASGMKVVSMEQGQPTQTYAAGEEEVCFVPRLGIMEIDGQQLKSTTFMIAIRKSGGDDWTFLEGAGLRNNPKMLQMLLPKLAPDIELPANRIEAL